jgi:hypothetical protein
VRRQRARFDEERGRIEAEFVGRVVGFVADERVVSDRVSTLLDDVLERYGGARQVYFEPIHLRGNREPWPS